MAFLIEVQNRFNPDLFIFSYLSITVHIATHMSNYSYERKEFNNQILQIPELLRLTFVVLRHLLTLAKH